MARKSTLTEARWRTSTHPDAMIDVLEGRVSDRKLRLFAVACCRRVAHAGYGRRIERAIDVNERFADGQATAKELKSAREGAHKFALTAGGAPALVAQAAESVAHPRLSPYFLSSCLGCVLELATWREGVSKEDERRRLCDLLRDVVGNPFRPPAFDPALRAAKGGLILSMAQDMYAARRFDDLPVLADALEEAGCADKDLLAHCRAGGEHARGCWVVDLVLDKT
jgi:hypothetical protein